MSNFHDPKVAEIVKQAERLVGKARQQRGSTDDLYRQYGLDPDKVRAVLEAHGGPGQREKARALVKADLQEIEQELAEEKARRRGTQSKLRVKRPRDMI
ncbi:hypothetical protein [Noviherbaspirillum sp.]|uniref:hypothetical protein n=1 Tax=Noviherbaspirillum sp. TaxID=1926288 RepID=UPI002B46A87C|nr:hypothetical protein [Noviherbaspirillum sp.]HJV80587.1 hypothetical protein [Noviherbaspirillum sp.]